MGLKHDLIIRCRSLRGQADFLTLSSRQLVLVASKPEPFIYDIGGLRYVLQREMDVEIPEAGEVHFWIDSCKTLGISRLAPAYSVKVPDPAEGLHWFDATSQQMWEWSGAKWRAVSRIFVGKLGDDGRPVCEPVGLSALARVMLSKGTNE